MLAVKFVVYDDVRYVTIVKTSVEELLSCIVQPEKPGLVDQRVPLQHCLHNPNLAIISGDIFAHAFCTRRSRLWADKRLDRE